MEVRLGQLLIQSGVLTQAQVEQALREQAATGEPFGLLCERLFSINPNAVEDAWATQYVSLTRRVDPLTEDVDRKALELVTRRQAWQFRVLPLRFDGNELMLATTRQHLRRALRFANNVIAVPVYLVLAEPKALGEALCRHYPLPGMTAGAIDDDGLDYLLGERRAKAGA
jgi:type IV pilus assembly protein PilB